MHQPADTEPGRKTAGTVVILAGDTIGAVARISWETTGGFLMPTLETLTASSGTGRISRGSRPCSTRWSPRHSSRTRRLRTGRSSHPS